MTESVALRPAPARFWPQGWWKVVEFRIGIVPLPVYVVLATCSPHNRAGSDPVREPEPSRRRQKFVSKRQLYLAGTESVSRHR